MTQPPRGRKIIEFGYPIAALTVSRLDDAVISKTAKSLGSSKNPLPVASPFSLTKAPNDQKELHSCLAGSDKHSQCTPKTPGWRRNEMNAFSTRPQDTLDFPLEPVQFHHVLEYIGRKDGIEALTRERQINAVLILHAGDTLGRVIRRCHINRYYIKTTARQLGGLLARPSSKL